MFPFILLALGAGALFLFLNKEESKKLPPGTVPGPVPSNEIPPEDLGTIMAFHAMMANPSQFAPVAMQETINLLESSGYPFEAFKLTSRINGAQFPTPILAYHDMMFGNWVNYSNDEIFATAQQLDSLGAKVESIDLMLLLGNIGER